MKVDIKINGHSYKIDMASTIIYDVVISTDQVKLQQTANEPGLQKQESLFTVENVRINTLLIKPKVPRTKQPKQVSTHKR
mgnify:FL=1